MAVLPAQDAQAEDTKVQEAPADEGVPRMTAKVLEESCVSNGGYAAPELNEVLMLHYKGFRKIEGLDAYTQVRSLFLDCNGIRKIENLEAMPLLVSLYLQSNCISTIENLEALTKLQYLNLSNNGVTHVSGLASLHSLETIKLAANKISNVEALQGLAERPSLKSIDVSCNYVEDGDAFVDFWGRNLPEVECLYLHHNSCSRSLKDYRRRLVSSLPKLRWIDERPVSTAERVGCEAWAVGGKEAEAEAKRSHWQQEQDEKRQSFQNFRRMQQAAADRARAQREAQASRDAARSQAADAFQNTGSVADGWTTVPSRPATGQRPEAVEPSRQQELRSKVEAFFKRPTVEAPVEAADAPVALEEPSGDGASDVLVPEEVILAGDRPEEAERAKGGDAPQGHASEETVAAEDEPASEVPFEWSHFRDKRLGRLVAEFRYNFRKAAEALGQEFACSVSEQECRSRYGQLTRPSSAASSGAQPRAADRGRARDAPEPDAAAVKEVSDWWMRQFAKAPRDAPSQISKLLGTRAAASESAPEEAEGEHIGRGRVAALPISPFAGLIVEDQSAPTPTPASAGAAAVPEEEPRVVDLTAFPAAVAQGAAAAEGTRRPGAAFNPPARSVAKAGPSESAGLFELD